MNSLFFTSDGHSNEYLEVEDFSSLEAEFFNNVAAPYTDLLSNPL